MDAYAAAIVGEVGEVIHLMPCLSRVAFTSNLLHPRGGVQSLIREFLFPCGLGSCWRWAFASNFAIPQLTSEVLNNCIQYINQTLPPMPNANFPGATTSSVKHLLARLTSELVHRRQPVDARHAYVVSDMSWALAARGVVPGIQDLIARMHIGPTHDFPLPRARPLAMHAVRARLDALLEAHPDLPLDLKRLRQDMGQGESSHKKARH